MINEIASKKQKKLALSMIFNRLLEQWKAQKLSPLDLVEKLKPFYNFYETEQIPYGLKELYYSFYLRPAAIILFGLNDDDDKIAIKSQFRVQITLYNFDSTKQRSLFIAVIRESDEMSSIVMRAQQSIDYRKLNEAIVTKAIPVVSNSKPAHIIYARLLDKLVDLIKHNTHDNYSKKEWENYFIAKGWNRGPRKSFHTTNDSIWVSESKNVKIAVNFMTIVGDNRQTHTKMYIRNLSHPHDTLLEPQWKIVAHRTDYSDHE